MSYRITQKQNVWSGRVDPSGDKNTLYWHQVVQLVSLDDLPAAQGEQIAFLGYKSDEGVRRNKGRVGAKDGPDEIRKSMAKFAVHFDSESIELVDVGNITTDGEDLESSQSELAEAINSLLQKGYRSILLGGGHEIAYGHYTGIRKYVGDQVLGIINLDAHFDLRAYPDGPHSGSPFRQVLDDCLKSGDEFHYLPIGISQSGNQKVLFEVHHQAGQQYIDERAIDSNHLEPVFEQIQLFADQLDHIYLTLDLDVISAAHAPGVSAPAAFGLEPVIVRQLIRKVFDTGKVISFDIAELNPKYDDGRTAKLAASFIYDVMMSCYKHHSIRN